MMLFAAAIISYAVVCGLLFVTYKYMPFSMVNSVWSVLSIVSIILIGKIYFGEDIPTHDYVALGFMMIGLFITFFVDGNDSKIIGESTGFD
jgi:multidrug transporter EmrE-like cation transporter